jgi:hypothetical protein
VLVFDKPTGMFLIKMTDLHISSATSIMLEASLHFEINN